MRFQWQTWRLTNPRAMLDAISEANMAPDQSARHVGCDFRGKHGARPKRAPCSMRFQRQSWRLTQSAPNPRAPQTKPPLRDRPRQNSRSEKKQQGGTSSALRHKFRLRINPIQFALHSRAIPAIYPHPKLRYSQRRRESREISLPAPASGLQSGLLCLLDRRRYESGLQEYLQRQAARQSSVCE